ncbi:Peptidyl-prolyl cis-trans isomerase B (cyclophilin-type PPIase family) [Legionella birminghamensis]|uniref:Peptidyl-prolyl cis-trans isomerase n=1 Tax=Legionella birminghamensis TaxID=28083 RepID=A0A378IDS7_9GAMM|nr:peptidylprolyl isomerase [Legionella birminghamensis]KTC66743.1 Peptidyl-prolyl cis-trans isomerase B (cyclophilin-type PPIase family) [Legionella birminghamensis]STX32892.1 Peptidyl-prolyl cis-trans isomerase B (cyclophilin-type PPIase family) [Legionella birminghamensis]
MITINTSKGDIRIQLHEDTSPETVENFKNYVNSGFYNDTIFHRVIPGFMIQGGGLTADMQQKKTNSPVKNEAKTAKLNKRGTIAMARTMDPHSATAQFFINVVDNGFLDFKAENAQGYGYCVFGEVVEGMDVVDEIAKVKTGNKMGHADVPVEEVTIFGMKEEE